jgi:hypothetical protein
VPLMQLEAPAERVVAPPPPPAPTVSAPAYEEVPLPEQAPPPACDQSATPSPCTQPHDAYRHDGFYFRLMNESQFFALYGEGPERDASIKGLGQGATLALGGTPAPGLVIGGMLNTTTLRGEFKGRPDGPENGATISRLILGPFVDWFPRPDDGWHVGAAIGFAAVTVTDSALADAVGPAFGAKIFGGYDFWIGPQWSVGLSATFSATPTTALRVDDGDKSGYRFYSLAAGIAGSLTLH